MTPTRIPAGEFKAKCLGLLDEVHVSGKEIIVTKRGRPVARVVAIREAGSEDVRHFGRLSGTVEIVGDIFSTGEQWEADSDNPDMSLYNLRRDR